MTNFFLTKYFEWKISLSHFFCLTKVNSTKLCFYNFPPKIFVYKIVFTKIILPDLFNQLFVAKLSSSRQWQLELNWDSFIITIGPTPTRIVQRSRSRRAFATFKATRDRTKPNLLYQIYQTKPTKPNLPNQTYQTKPNNVSQSK